MKFVLKPSLEHMSAVKIAVLLWNQNDIRDLIAKLDFLQDPYYRREKWEKIEERVMKKVPQLSLPELIEEKMCVIKPIGLQILKWMVFHHSDCRLLLNQPAKFFWTPQGTLDGKKTAEVLVKDENLDTPTRYKLACIYCLEDDIDKFWNEHVPYASELSYRIDIIKFWSCYVEQIRLGNVRIDDRGQIRLVDAHLNSNDRIRLLNAHLNYSDQFYSSASCGNKVAAEYFRQKLTLQERDIDKNLIRIAKSVKDADLLYFLLTKMNDEEQMEVFKSGPCKVLKYFLEWPLQNFFIEVANCMWDFLTGKEFDLTLKRIIIQAFEGQKDWDYKGIFREFWRKSPSNLKHLIINKLDETLVLEALFLVKDKINTHFILKDVTLTVKESIIYQHKTCCLLQRHILAKEWDFLEFFIRECLSSKDQILEYKIYFIDKCIKDHIVVDAVTWDQLFVSSDYPIKHKQKYIGESSSSKRFCKN